MEIIKKDILIQAGQARMPGLFYRPPGTGPFPAVVVFHGSDGYKPNHGGVAHRLAGEGFAALAPAWFGEDPARAHWDEIRSTAWMRILCPFCSFTAPALKIIFFPWYFSGFSCLHERSISRLTASLII